MISGRAGLWMSGRPGRYAQTLENQTMAEITGVVPCLNRKQGSSSVLMLTGSGLSKDDPVEITAMSTNVWSGQITFASPKGKYFLAEVTCQIGTLTEAEDPDFPDVTQQLSITVTHDGEPVTDDKEEVDLYYQE